jgi:hypothetical protein
MANAMRERCIGTGPSPARAHEVMLQPVSGVVLIARDGRDSYAACATHAAEDQCHFL